jgi:adenylate cyclase
MTRDRCFGDYRFDVESGRLWSGAGEIRLTPKASAVLTALIARAGQPVSKEQLFASVWKGTIVSDDALTSCIQELRRALGDNAKQPRFIETRHRRGYQFVAQLSAPSADDAAPPADLAAIAVLPFADMSPDRDQEYLCEGLAEELINALTHVDGLRVASRTASFQFRGTGGNVREIGRQLGVGTLLEGSVRKVDDQLRIIVQLIEVATGYHRWSERFDRKFDDVFAIQDEIARSVATSLRGAALDHRVPQAETAAYEDYLRGRQLLVRMTQADVKRSGELFGRAIAIDRRYAPAWAGLATVHATLYEWFGANRDDLDRADTASRHALELASNLSEAHVARGFVLSLQRSYEAAAREFEAAREINPNLFDAYYYDARAAFAHGDIARSAELYSKAADVRKEDFQSALLCAQSLGMLGRSEEEKRARSEGLRRAEHALALNPLDVRALALGSTFLLFDGQIERAHAWSRRSVELDPNDLSTLVLAACFHARLGLKDEAFGYLERVCDLGWGKRDWVEHEPDYDNLRDDPRFEQIVARLK